MYGRTPPGGYRLADKLRQEYRDRGDHLRGIGAVSTEELMHRAQMGQDPTENVSEEAFSDRLRNRNYTYEGRTYSRSTPSAGAYHSGTERAYSPRRSRPASARTQQQRTRTRNDAGHARKRRRTDESKAGGEVQVKTKGLSVGYLVMLAMVTMMVMTILLSIAQIYQTTNNIAQMEKQLRSLQAEAAELELAIEEKNDIRIIEQIATDQLGMVKEDSVQRKYISLSDGERIDIVGEDEETDKGSVGTLLSSLVSALTRFFTETGD